MRVIYYLQNNIRAIHILAITFLTLTSCGTYQQASYDDDGIYGSEQQPRQTTEVATNTNNNSVYQNYFEQKSLEANDRYGEVFTDIDTYSSQENLDAETDVDAVGYSEGNSPWGDETDDVIINVYSNPIGFGGGWGFNRWGWGFNRWGFNGFGNNWGFGFGGAFWDPFWGPGLFNPYFGNGGFFGYGGFYGRPFFNNRFGNGGYYAYNRGRRGNYYRNGNLVGRNADSSYSRRGNNNYSRRYNASRSSRRNNARATRSNTRTIRSTQNTRTRTNTRVTRNNTRVRSNTRSTRSTRNSNFRSNSSSRSSSFRSGGGRSGGGRSGGGRSGGGRGGRG